MPDLLAAGLALWKGATAPRRRHFDRSGADRFNLLDIRPSFPSEFQPVVLGVEAAQHPPRKAVSLASMTSIRSIADSHVLQVHRGTP
jgi:hypothetical protein